MRRASSRSVSAVSTGTAAMYPAKKSPLTSPASVFDSAHSACSLGRSAGYVAKPVMLKTWARHTHPMRRAGELTTEDTEKGQGLRYLDVRLLSVISVPSVAKPLSSAMLERGLALLHERPHPLLLVLGGEQRVEGAALEEHALRERGFVGAVDGL